MDGLFHGLNPIKMDDSGVKPTIFGNIHIKLDSFYFMALWMSKYSCRNVGRSLAVTASKV